MRPASLVALLAAPFAFLLACDQPKGRVADAGSEHIQSDPAPPALASGDSGIPIPGAETIAVAQRVTGSILVGGHAMGYLRELADGVGPRLTGSDGLVRAAAWAEDAFRKAGISHVAVEPFALPATWSRRPTLCRVVAPEERLLTSVAIGWMPPTPADGIRGEVVRVKDLSLAGQKALGAGLRGRIALFDREAYKTAKKIDRSVAVKGLAERGAIGAVIIGSRDNEVLGATTLAGLDLVGALPAVSIGKEDGGWISRQMEKGPVTLAFTNESAVGGPATVPDVVAEIPGRELPDEWVLVGAHLDSWDLATGAQDNGSGAVEVLDAARAIAATGTRPRRSIRFALWGGEEQGLFGSRAYAAAHAAELDRLVFVLNTDHGAGAPKGWNLDGREDAVEAFRAFTEPYLAGLGATGIATELTCDTDHCAFMLAGAPTANLDVDMSHYGEIHHTPGDTLEKVAPGALASAAAIVGVTAYAIADAPERLARKLDHATVAKNLKKAEIADELSSGGYWKP